MGKGLGASIMHRPPNMALQSSPTSTSIVYTSVKCIPILLPSQLFMTISSYTKTTLQKVMTRPPVTIICFEI